jgi:hypothetical protein
MKTLCCFIVLMLAPFLAEGLGLLQSNEVALATNYAKSNFTAFTNSINAANYSFFGLQSQSDLAQLTNDQPLVVYTIQLNPLRNYHPGDDRQALLERSSQVIIPLVVGTNVRSSISFSLNVTANTVSNVKFGRRKLIRELMATYRSIDTHQVKADGAPFAVEIPVFDIWLIGYVNVQNELELIATIDLPLRDMVVSRGERISEAAMFRMAIMAQQYNGLPN